MAINFGAEYKRFKKEMEKKHELYTQLGMSQEQIDALEEFDKEEFLSNNTYKRHVQSLSIDEDSDNPENLRLLFKKFGVSSRLNSRLFLAINMPGWTIFRPCLFLEKLLSLSEDDLDLLDAYVFNEKRYREIGEARKVTPQCIYKKIQRIKKYLADG